MVWGCGSGWGSRNAEMITIMTIYTIMVIRCGILRKWEITEAGYGWLWG